MTAILGEGLSLAFQEASIRAQLRAPSRPPRRSPLGFHYRAIVFNAEWQATGSFDIDAVCDEEALFLARERAGTWPFELLDGMSVLGRFAYEGASGIRGYGGSGTRCERSPDPLLWPRLLGSGSLAWPTCTLLFGSRRL